MRSRSARAWTSSRGRAREPRLLEVTLALAGHLLQQGGLAASPADGEQRARAALDSGAAAERFARMVAALGGPRDVLARGGALLPRAPVQRPLPSPRDGVVAAMDTRAIGLAVIALGGGRARAGDAIDPRVGLSDVRGGRRRGSRAASRWPSCTPPPTTAQKRRCAAWRPRSSIARSGDRAARVARGGEPLSARRPLARATYNRLRWRAMQATPRDTHACRTPR